MRQYLEKQLWHHRRSRLNLGKLILPMFQRFVFYYFFLELDQGWGGGIICLCLIRIMSYVAFNFISSQCRKITCVYYPSSIPRTLKNIYTIIIYYVLFLCLLPFLLSPTHTYLSPSKTIFFFTTRISFSQESGNQQLPLYDSDTHLQQSNIQTKIQTHTFVYTLNFFQFPSTESSQKSLVGPRLQQHALVQSGCHIVGLNPLPIWLRSEILNHTSASEQKDLDIENMTWNL